MPRKLRVRIVHDSDLPPSPLGTDDFELVPLECYRGGECPYLRSWEDHLQIWDQIAEGDGPAIPDLYLIDCHFEEDDGPPVVLGPPGDEVDGRGLLHGVVQLAYAIGKEPQHPFGFSIYSGDPTRVKGDPYAVTTFGLLEAMRGNLIPFEDVLRSGRPLRERVCDTLDGLQHGGSPRTAWEDALVMYRDRLHWLATHNAIALSTDNVDAAVAEFRRFIGGGAAPANNLTLEWIRVRKREEVFLCSIFADCHQSGVWDATKIREMLEWLERLQKLNWHERDYGGAKAYLNLLDAHTAGDPIEHPSVRTRGIAMCMFIVLGLANKPAPRSEMNRSAIESFFEWDPQQTSRAVKEGLGASMTVNDLIDAMAACDEWPLDSVVLASVQEYLKDNHMLPWPRCVR